MDTAPYTCCDCGTALDEAECDRNLLGDYPFCDECHAALMAGYTRYMRWDGLRRAWRRLLARLDRRPVGF